LDASEKGRTGVCNRLLPTHGLRARWAPTQALLPLPKTDHIGPASAKSDANMITWVLP